MGEEKKKKDSVLRDISKQAVEDIIVPKTKESVNNMASDILYMMADTLVQIVGRLIFGKDTPVPSRSGKDREQYSNVSKQKSTRENSVSNIGLRSSTDVQYCCFYRYETAKKVRDSLLNYYKDWNYVRLADLYECTSWKDTDRFGNETPAAVKVIIPNNTDYRYGWTDPNEIHFEHNRDGFWFNVPTPVQLQK